MSNPKALVSKRQTTPEVDDDELVNVGAGIVAAGSTLTIGTAEQTVNIPGTLAAPVSGGLAAEFEIDGTAVSADVTAANLDELTGGGETALHSHAGVPALFEVDGVAVSANVTAANLTSLTGGSSTTLHSHPNTIQKSPVTFSLAELQALAGGVTHLEKTIVLPANARFVIATSEGVTPFEVDQSGDTYGITIGTSTGGNQVCTSLDVSFGQTGFPNAFTAGAQGYNMATHSAATFYVRLSSADDLNLTVAGGATVNVFYAIVP